MLLECQKFAKTKQRGVELMDKKSNSRVTESRFLAYQCLDIIRKRDAFAHDIIRANIDDSKLSAHDKAFAAKLVLGVIDYRGTLDFVLDRCMNSTNDVKPNVRDALRISTYELLYLDKASYAAVDQGVELVAAIAPRARKLANAILRKVSKSAEHFPFGDPKKDIRSYALLNGFPLWLVKKLFVELEPKPANDFIVASNEDAPIYVAVNALFENDEDVERFIKRHDLKEVAINGEIIGGCYLSTDRKIVGEKSFTRLVDEGKMLISDASAQAISQIIATSITKLSAERNISIDDFKFLELCSGRGTKTLLIQSDIFRTTNHQLRNYKALDNVTFKKNLLLKRAKQYGIDVLEALEGDATDLSRSFNTETFDAVFIDSPCSGLGTLRRHPEIRWRIKQEAICDFAALDLKILKSAANHVNVGGFLIYATCTVTHEENDQAIYSFLNSDEGKNFKIEKLGESDFFFNKLVSKGPDSHFCAVLRRQR